MPTTVRTSTLDPMMIHTAVDLCWRVSERQRHVCAVVNTARRAGVPFGGTIRARCLLLNISA
jgi:hypothetical protein